MLPVAEILGHVSLKTVSNLSLSSDTQSVTSLKDRRGPGPGEKSGESQEVERDWKI